jgi:hypothetical protein
LTVTKIRIRCAPTPACSLIVTACQRAPERGVAAGFNSQLMKARKRWREQKKESKRQKGECDPLALAVY